MDWEADKLLLEPASDSPCSAGGLCFTSLTEHVVSRNTSWYIALAQKEKLSYKLSWNWVSGEVVFGQPTERIYNDQINSSCRD